MDAVPEFVSMPFARAEGLHRRRPKTPFMPTTCLNALRSGRGTAPCPSRTTSPSPSVSMPFARAEGLHLVMMVKGKTSASRSQCPSLGPRDCTGGHHDGSRFRGLESQCPSLGPRDCTPTREEADAEVEWYVSMPFARAEGLHPASIANPPSDSQRLNALRSGRGTAPRGPQQRVRDSSGLNALRSGRGTAPRASRPGTQSPAGMSQCPSLGPRDCTQFPASEDTTTGPGSQCPSLGPRDCTDNSSVAYTVLPSLNALRSGRGTAPPPLTTLSNRRQSGVFFGSFA